MLLNCLLNSPELVVLYLLIFPNLLHFDLVQHAHFFQHHLRRHILRFFLHDLPPVPVFDIVGLFIREVALPELDAGLFIRNIDIKQTSKLSVFSLRSNIKVLKPLQRHLLEYIIGIKALLSSTIFLIEPISSMAKALSDTTYHGQTYSQNNNCLD